MLGATDGWTCNCVVLLILLVLVIITMYTYIGRGKLCIFSDATSLQKQSWWHSNTQRTDSSLFPGLEGKHELEYLLEYQTWRHRFAQPPINPADMDVAFYFNENYRALEVFSNISKSRVGSIIIVGGSETAGHECHPSQGSSPNKKCAWSRYFSDWLNHKYPTVNWTVDNVAEGGIGIDSWYHKLTTEQLAKYHLMILDTTVNSQAKDAQEIKSELDRFLYKFHGIPKISLSMFRTCNYTLSDCNLHCSYFEQGRLPDGYSWCYKWWRVQDYESDIYRYYNVSLMSFRDATWPNLGRPPKQLPGIWRGLSHPDYIGHQLIANMVQFCWSKMSNMAAVTSIVDRQLEAKPYFDFTRAPSCTTRHVFLDHENCDLKETTVDGFSCKEDVPGKRGWISEYESGKTPNEQNMHAIFVTNLAKIGILVVEYLESYDRVGLLEVYLDNDAEAAVNIDAHTKEHYSVTKFFEIDVNGHKNVSFVHKYKSGYPKFKIISISGC